MIAIERDPRCVAALDELVALHDGRLQLLAGDALETDFAALAAATGGKLTIVANLPFNVATPLLLDWLRHCRVIEQMVLMFQKEVADRLIAAPRTKAYGRLSVVTQWLCSAERLFTVPPRAFVPPPKVTSTVVRLVPRATPLAPASFAALGTVTAAAFGRRRKMLRGALKPLFADPERVLAQAGIAPTRRAEELSVIEFCALAQAYAASGAA